MAIAPLTIIYIFVFLNKTNVLPQRFVGIRFFILYTNSIRTISLKKILRLTNTPLTLIRRIRERSPTKTITPSRRLPDLSTIITRRCRPTCRLAKWRISIRVNMITSNHEDDHIICGSIYSDCVLNLDKICFMT